MESTLGVDQQITYLRDKRDDLVARPLRPLLNLLPRCRDGIVVVGADELAHTEEHVHTWMDVAVVKGDVHLERARVQPLHATQAAMSTHVTDVLYNSANFRCRESMVVDGLRRASERGVQVSMGICSNHGSTCT